jgi:hypothetical protein
MQIIWECISPVKAKDRIASVVYFNVTGGHADAQNFLKSPVQLKSTCGPRVHISQTTLSSMVSTSTSESGSQASISSDSPLKPPVTVTITATTTVSTISSRLEEEISSSSVRASTFTPHHSSLPFSNFGSSQSEGSPAAIIPSINLLSPSSFSITISYKSKPTAIPANISPYPFAATPIPQQQQDATTSVSSAAQVRYHTLISIAWYNGPVTTLSTVLSI